MALMPGARVMGSEVELGSSDSKNKLSLIISAGPTVTSGKAFSDIFLPGTNYGKIIFIMTEWTISGTSTQCIMLRPLYSGHRDPCTVDMRYSNRTFF